MKIILGIGNIGSEYEDTRHNSGFQAIDVISEDFHIDRGKKKFDSFVGKGNIYGEDVLLRKPTTYVNLSGNALIQAKNFFKVDTSDILILVDDRDTEPGSIRLRRKGAAGGHNGLKSIISVLGTDTFNRIRIGIGRPEIKHSDVADFVLSHPKDKEVYEKWKDGINKAAAAAEYCRKFSFDKARNRFNK